MLRADWASRIYFLPSIALRYLAAGFADKEAQYISDWGRLVYGRNMILPIQYKADWATIKLKKRKGLIKSSAEKALNGSVYNTKKETRYCFTSKGSFPSWRC